MIDIISADENGMGTYDTQTQKAANLFSVQLGALEYAPDFGIDLRYFLSDEFEFQTESFQSYLVQTAANNGINVASLMETDHDLFKEFIFNLVPPETSGSLIAR